ncbi:endo-1,3(4)-beta-glucanase [Pilobolus umbonatus]|nr:endo-1,3(4)-beta-glucanase [Pilobolus umbonatus]
MLQSGKWTAITLFISVIYTVTVSCQMSVSSNKPSKYFTPISTVNPLSFLESIAHPHLPLYENPRSKKVVPTNSWISNLFYPSVENLAPTTPDPYTIRLGFAGPPGLAIAQTAKKILGTYPPMNNVPYTPGGYMINGVFVDLRISTVEWGSEKPKQEVTDWNLFGANLKLSSGNGSVEFPISRGMAYVTSIFDRLTPQFSTQHHIVTIEADKKVDDITYSGHKFKVTYNDDPASTFIIYALGKSPLVLKREGPSNLISQNKYTGPIQVAKLPSPAAESTLDRFKGVWTSGGEVSMIDSSTYSIEWYKQGVSSSLPLIYAYPHHAKSFVKSSIVKTDLVLESATKGSMVAVVSSKWILKETDLSKIGWFPTKPTAPPSVRKEILKYMATDIDVNYADHTLKDTNYFSGKGLQKFALLALALNKPAVTGLRDPALARKSLQKLKDAFVPYLENRQNNYLLYDSVYKGIVGRIGLPTSMGGVGDIYAEFGHSYYNDHHYHYGYFTVTAAIIHYLDPTWRTKEIRQWTEALIRDVNNPVDNDPHFAQFRSYDWFAGHTWAGGIKVNGALDGRDQESVSESVNFYWGMKLWGLATNKRNLVSMADLQLAIIKRTTYEYFYFLDTNRNRPAEIVRNKVIGIYFEQKMDYTTYFGRFVEYIHGIQQLPMTPMLGEYIRTHQFVQEEWDQKLAPIVSSVEGGWNGILRLNHAMLKPSESYPLLRTAIVDDGQTTSYSLYFTSTQPGFKL